MNGRPDPARDARRIDVAEYFALPGHGQLDRDEAHRASDRYDRELVGEVAMTDTLTRGPLVITEPGVYPDVDERAYHRDPVAGGSLSSTGARTLIDRSPAHFAYQREHGRADTKAFDLGHAAHAQVLGVGGEVVVVTGSGKDPNAWRTDADKKAVAAARAAGDTPVTPNDRARVDAMVTAIRSHPVAGPLFARDGAPELTVIARDPESGVMCRVRLDWLVDVEPGQRLIAVDLKSTTNAAPAAFAKSVADYGYHQQDPFYVDSLHWLGMTDGPDGEPVEPLFVFVTVEKDPPHLVSVHRITEEDRARGRVLNRKARDLFRVGQETGQWPGIEPVVHDLALPVWARVQHDTAENAGRFDTLADLELEDA